MCKTGNLDSGKTIVTTDPRQTAICRIGQRMDGLVQSGDDSIVEKKSNLPKLQVQVEATLLCQPSQFALPGARPDRSN